MSYGADAPAYWDPSLAGDESNSLEQEHCVIKAEHFFVRGRLVIPVSDAAPGGEFDWGVWVSLSRDNFARAQSLWTTAGREREQPYFGWLSTDLPLYQPSTLSLKARVHTQPVGQRPLIELEPTDHPLAVEQRTGITRARVREIAETLLHALHTPRSGEGWDPSCVQASGNGHDVTAVPPGLLFCDTAERGHCVTDLPHDGFSGLGSTSHRIVVCLKARLGTEPSPTSPGRR
jgi:hypothetical protein